MKYSFKDFPESTKSTPEMKVIQGDSENIAPKIDKLQPIYAVKDGLELRLKFIFPMEDTRPEKKYPLVVYVKGSAWRKQDIDNQMMDLYPIVKQGVAVAVVQYRPSVVAAFPAQVEDTKSAVRYLVKHAAAYPIDLENIFLAGDSSGGHTVLCCLATWEDDRLDDEGGPLPKLKGCVDFYGPTHLEKMCEEPSAEHAGPNSFEGKLIGGFDITKEVEMAYQASPVSYFSAGQAIAPLLIIHGSKDRQVPFGQSVLLYDHLTSLGIKNAELYQVKGADHGGSLFWCEAVTDLVNTFISEHCDK